jgi:hypothetical protein
MSSLSLYQLSVVCFIRGLERLSSILNKGLAHAEASGVDANTLVQTRLAPDMFTLAGQVQGACDAAKAATARLAAMTPPSFPDNEATFAELQQRIAKTLDFIRNVEPAQIDSALERTITLKLRGNEVTFEAQPYLSNFVLPNFYFHVTTAYDILRQQGVALGKMDYLGSF